MIAKYHKTLTLAKCMHCYSFKAHETILSWCWLSIVNNPDYTRIWIYLQVGFSVTVDTTWCITMQNNISSSILYHRLWMHMIETPSTVNGCYQSICRIIIVCIHLQMNSQNNRHTGRHKVMDMSYKTNISSHPSLQMLDNVLIFLALSSVIQHNHGRLIVFMHKFHTHQVL